MYLTNSIFFSGSKVYYFKNHKCYINLKKGTTFFKGLLFMRTGLFIMFESRQIDEEGFMKSICHAIFILNKSFS